MPQRLTAETLDLRGIVRTGDAVLWGQACGEPQTLTEALVRQRADLGGVSVYLGASYSETLKPEHADHLKLFGFGAIGTGRRLSKRGALQIIPCHMGQISAYIAQGLVPCDVAMIQVAPVLDDGTYSYGLVNDYTQTMVARARVVIAEVNDQVPQTCCQGTLAARDIDYIVPTSRPPVALAESTSGEIDRTIAGHAAAYIGDGAVLQVGVGAVPDAVMQLLTDRRDLGVHSGSIGDGLVALAERGVVTNASKPIDRGVSVAGMLIGSPRLFRFAHRNGALSLRPQAYTHSAEVLARLPNLVTINTALEIDLTGQANAEQIGDSYLGGVGGQPEFVRAGHRARHSILALPATARNGASRICARLSAGVVTSPRTDVDVVVTEFGAAELRGQPIPERARRLIAIAAPAAREGLEREAHALMQRGY